MKSIEEFQAYFERELHPRLAALQLERDAARPDMRRWWRWCGVILSVVAVLTALMLMRVLPERQWSGPLAWLLIMALFVLPMIGIFREIFWSGKYKQREKSESLVPAIRFLAPEFNYLESQFVSPEKVRASRIFESDKPILKIGGDDYFSGKIEKTNVEFSEVVVELDSGQRGGKNDVSNRIYTGMYLVADFNKPFSHTTLVMPRSQLVDSSDPFVRAVMQGVKVVVEGAEALLSGLENAVEAASNWYQIRTENSEFEQFFSTFGSDRVESYYILTPDLMERLVAFRRAVGSDVSLSFIGSVMHAYINCGPLFEINDDEGDRTVFAAYQHYYGQLRMVFDLVEAMHLNVRLWGKA